MGRGRRARLGARSTRRALPSAGPSPRRHHHWPCRPAPPPGTSPQTGLVDAGGEHGGVHRTTTDTAPHEPAAEPAALPSPSAWRTAAGVRPGTASVAAPGPDAHAPSAAHAARPSTSRTGDRRRAGRETTRPADRRRARAATSLVASGCSTVNRRGTWCGAGGASTPTVAPTASGLPGGPSPGGTPVRRRSSTRRVAVISVTSRFRMRSPDAVASPDTYLPSRRRIPAGRRHPARRPPCRVGAARPGVPGSTHVGPRWRKAQASSTATMPLTRRLNRPATRTSP